MACLNRLKHVNTAKGTRYLIAALLVSALACAGNVGPASAESSTYTITGSWTAPEGVTSVTVEVWGGGGGGGGGTGAAFGGSGGGGGGYARKNGIPVVPGSGYAFTVGSGGAAGPSSPGGPGGQSFFMDAGTVMANGGGGGGTNGSSPGSGGTGAVGDMMYVGGMGVAGIASGGGGGSSAGNSSPGSSGSGLSGGIAPAGGGNGGDGSSATHGNPGISPGGGGGGAFKTTALMGGSGNAGQVVVTYALPTPGTPAVLAVSTTSMVVTWSATSTLRGYLVQASTAANFTGVLFSSQTPSVSLSTLTVNSLAPNATYHIRVGTLWNLTTYYASVLSTATAIETPSAIYFDEISTWSITASAYAPQFTGMERGFSGVAITTDAAYEGWNSPGNYWTTKLNIGTSYNNPAAAAVGGKLYFFGGTPDGATYSAVTNEYDPALNSWQTRANMINGRSMLAAAASGGKIYALGGLNLGGTRNLNEEYDPAANAWRARTPMPDLRERHAAVALNGKVYVIGGNNGGVKNNVYAYDPAADSWAEKQPLSVAKERVAAGVINGRIYIAGGFDTAHINTVEEYDPVTNAWSNRALMQTSRSGAAAGAIGGKLYVVGGYNGSNLNINEVYDPATDSWATGAPAFTPREGMAFGVVKGKMYLVAGNNGGYLNSNEEYNPGVSMYFKGLSPNRYFNFKAKARSQNWLETGEVMVSTYTLAIATMPAGPVFSGLSSEGVAVSWSSGSLAGGFNGSNASYLVQASTQPNFSSIVRYGNTWDQTIYGFSSLSSKTTYYFRVQAYNSAQVTDYSWTVLGSTRTLSEPLPGTAVSTMVWNSQNFNWPRTMARDSQGNLYTAYLKKYSGKFRIFLSSSMDNGETWSDTTPVPIETAGDVPAANSYDQYWPALAVDSQDVLHLVWGGANTTLDPGGAEAKCVYSSAAAPGTNWSPHVKIPAHAFEGVEGPFNIAVDSNDGLHIVWNGENAGVAGGKRIRYSSRTADGPWAAYTELNDDGKQADYPALAIDSKDGVHILVKRAVSVGSNTTPLISYSSRTTSGSWNGWTDVHDGGGYHQSPPSLTIDTGGNLFAAWSSADGGYVNSQVKYSRLPAGGGWSAMSYVDTVPEAPQTNPSAAADALGNVFVLWSGSDTVNDTVNLKVNSYDGATWDITETITDEDSGAQMYPALRWAGWRNNGGGIDVVWNSWDGYSSTATLRMMLGEDVPMSPGWSKTNWPVPAGCGYAINVRKDGAADFAGIQQALGAVPQELSTNTCVVIRDDQTYMEQVTVEGIKTSHWDGNTSYRLVIMKDPTFVSSGPVVSPPASSTAAFHIMNASVTVAGFEIIPAGSVQYGVMASSADIRLSSITITAGASVSTAAIALGDRGIVSYSTASVQNAHGLWLNGGGSSVEKVYVTNNSTDKYALYMGYTSSSTVTGSYFYNSGGTGAAFTSFSSYNTVSQSTVSANGSAHRAVVFNGGYWNTVSGSYLSNPPCVGVQFAAGASSNTVSQSTITNNSGSFPTVSFYWTNYNAVTGSKITNQGGMAVINEGANYSDVRDSSLMANSGSFYAMKFTDASSNTVAGSHISNSSGEGIQFVVNSAFNTVDRSTITAGGTIKAAINFSGAGSMNTVMNSYVQGSTAVYVGSSGVVIFRGDTLWSSSSYGHGLRIDNSNAGVFATTSTFRGGTYGTGIHAGYNFAGKIELASNTVTGGKYGLTIENQAGPVTLRISSITFASLSPGATAINFAGGLFATDIEKAAFISTNIAVNVNSNGLSPTSLIMMPGATGPRWGAYYENDPMSYVYWDTVAAELVGPADGAIDVSPAAALYARAPLAVSTAQYQYQFDTLPTMDSVGSPLFDFDQFAMQEYPGTGAFSGQDAARYAAGDAYIHNSTATFVFYSTYTTLGSYMTYYWRARVKTLETGEYGPWTSTASFTAGRIAAGSPDTNNIVVADVALSSPTVSGVSISFTLKENNVVSGSTPNEASYKTADWIFVKFSTQAGADGTWHHATLTGGAVNGPATLAAASDNMGVFVTHNQNAAYWTAGATVTWNYGADGVSGANARVKVFAVSMVKVPTGSFVYNAGGIGGATYNNYGGGAQMTVNSTEDLPVGAAAGWPNGYNSFYIMRYELTQGQYADFLNTVHSSTAAALYAGDVNYGHNMGYNPPNPYGWRYSAVDRFAAKNYLSTNDMWSFLSWAGLRPMTEMEYEKACRDTGSDARTYPWGSSLPDTDTYNPPNEGGTHKRNFANHNNTSGGQKVLDVGRYMAGDVYRTPEQTGASPYGIADLVGNAGEHVIACSYTTVPDNGSGTVAWPSNWPAAGSTQKGLRGGDWSMSSSFVDVSRRTYIPWTNTTRDTYVGGRGVRTP